MLRYSLIFLIIAIAAVVYALVAPSIFANFLTFGSIVVLYLSLLGNKKRVH